MPVVLRFRGFRVIVLLPPREHAPAHVHVENAEGEVIIELSPLRVREISGMRASDVRTAFRFVESHVESLRDAWRRYHGDQ